MNEDKNENLAVSQDKAGIISPFSGEFEPKIEAQLAAESIAKRKNEEKKIPGYVLDDILKNTKSKSVVIILFDEDLEQCPMKAQSVYISASHVPPSHMEQALSMVLDIFTGRLPSFRTISRGGDNPPPATPA
jgi:hypothetical protein